MTFPLHRMRRLRATPRSRELFREARLHPSILIEPFFVGEGNRRRDPISAMPGIHQLSTDTLVTE